jgi:hypothetical protein
MAEDGSEWVKSQVVHGVNDMVQPPHACALLFLDFMLCP